MHKKLLEKLISNPKDIENTKVRNEYGRVTALLGIFSNILLFVIKVFLGLIFSSISILADAINNLVDTLSSVVTLLGFKFSSKPADSQHPFGHARFESISGLLVGIVVVYVGIEFIQASIKEIINPTALKVNALLLVLLFITALIKLWQYRFNTYVGKKIKSNLILTTAIDSRNDMLITGLVLISVIFEYFFKIKVDGIVGLILALIIISSGVFALKESIADLLGKRVSEEQLIKIEKLFESYDDILDYHDLQVHDYGHNRLFATVDVEVDASFSLVFAHNVVDKIEKDFIEKLNIELVVHLDPVILNDPYIDKYWRSVKKIIKSYDKKYSMHDFRLKKNEDYNLITFDLVVDKDESKSDEEIISDLKNLILKKFTGDKVEITLDRNYLCSRR